MPERQYHIGNSHSTDAFRADHKSSLGTVSVVFTEVVCCDERGLAVFQVLRHRRNEPQAFLYVFDLLELNGADLRREPIEVRKATLASILRRAARACA
jgi:ATP-dependent DNA ligase